MNLDVIFVKKDGLYRVVAVGGSEDGRDYAASSAMAEGGRHSSAIAVPYITRASVEKNVFIVFGLKKILNEKGKEVEQFLMTGEEPTANDFFIYKQESSANTKFNEMTAEYANDDTVTIYKKTLIVY